MLNLNQLWKVAWLLLLIFFLLKIYLNPKTAKSAFIQAVEMGEVSSCDHSGWEFMASILFAITIMSTIGYGNVALATDAGKIVAICYACVGKESDWLMELVN